MRLGTDKEQRAEWVMTISLGLAMLLVPIAFAVLLSAEGGEASGVSPASSRTQAESDRSARVTFRLDGDTLGLRILRKAPRETRLLRGREVRVLCGSTAGLVIREARWPRGSDTLRVELAGPATRRIEFCALKRARGHRGVARVVFR